MSDNTTIYTVEEDDRFTVVTAANWYGQFLVEGWRSDYLFVFFDCELEELEDKEKIEFQLLHKELEEIEFMSHDEVDLRVQSPGARKHAASALRAYFTLMVRSLDEKTDKAWVVELKQMIDNLTEVIDRADTTIESFQ